MHTVETKYLSELYDRWHRDTQPNVRADRTDVSGDCDVRYLDGELSPKLVDTIMQHYLNEHVPSTWRLLAFCVDSTSVRFVWRHSE